MPTPQNIKFNKLVSAVVLADNTPEEERQYAITAEVSVSGDRADIVNNGQVFEVESGASIASFHSAYGGFSISFGSSQEASVRSAVFAAAARFVEDAKAKAAEGILVEL